MNYVNILDCDILDGEGVRVTLYVSGCGHKCKGCHNPETWDKKYGKEFTYDTKEKIFFLLERDYIDGLTISGGDPLFLSNIAYRYPSFSFSITKPSLPCSYGLKISLKSIIYIYV